jgi:hypothetical protein
MVRNAEAETPITLTVSLTFPEYLRLCYLLSLRASILLVVFGVLFFVGGLAILLGASTLGIAPEDAYPMWTGLLLLAVLFLGLTPAIVYWSARRRWACSPSLREPNHITFDESGVHGRMADASGSLGWRHIVKARRLGGFAILTTGQRINYVIPMRAFPDDETYQKFVRLVREKVSDCRL